MNRDREQKKDCRIRERTQIIIMIPPTLILGGIYIILMFIISCFQVFSLIISIPPDFIFLLFSFIYCLKKDKKISEFPDVGKFPVTRFFWKLFPVFNDFVWSLTTA